MGNQCATDGGRGCEITLIGHVHYVLGRIDEFSSLISILAEKPDPKEGRDARSIHLNVRGVRSINTMGVRRFLEFTRAASPVQIHLHECGVVILDALSAIPDLFVPNGRVAIHSLVLPYACEECGRSSEMAVSHGSDEMPPDEPMFQRHAECARCGGQQTLQVDGMNYRKYMAVSERVA